MKISSFLKLVEIQTKAASIIPFILGNLYALLRFESFSLKNFLLMLISLLSIDMATTAINNYIDYKKAIKTEGFGYESHNAIVKDGLKESTVQATIGTLLAIAVVFGILLFLNTNLVVLILGAISFGIGICYTFGPVPISRTPFGEIFSGFTMGFVIFFLAIYIHVFAGDLVTLGLLQGIFSISVNLKELIYIFIISISVVSGIANIMLANNICDIEDDIHNKRYTLPIFIGKERALKLFAFLYYAAYVAIVIAVLLGALPWLSLLTIFTLNPVKNNIKAFKAKQTKKDTFILAVKNFILINAAHIILLSVGAIINRL